MAGQRTVGPLGALLFNDRLHDATAHSPLTLSCRGETALSEGLGIPPSKQLPTQLTAAQRTHAALAASMEWELCKRLKTEKERVRKQVREVKKGGEGEFTAVN